ncbi:MAG TPA: IS110 family transposase [Acidobacteriaceae bacterium]|nr:IS110 family transposase [Acidobacteriaceae bacterium]
MKITTVGIDLAKDVFRVHGCDARGKVVVSKSLTRHDLRMFMAKLRPYLVGMEACHTAHYWAHELQQFGHQVKLMAPRFIRPYVKNNKNDTRDAEAICEAVTRPTMRFVPIKSRAQLDVQAVHRVRQQVVKERMTLANQLRAFLAEHGIVMRKGFSAVKCVVPDVIENADNGLSGLMRELLRDLYERFRLTEERLHRYDELIEKVVEQDERCQRLAQLPGVGPLTATAVVASVGNAREFRSGRELAAFFGLVPRHYASGGRTIMLPIAKRCDHYLRTLMVQGARASMRYLDRRRDPRGIWANRLRLKRGSYITAVAIANKNARVMWALLTRGESYRETPAQRAPSTLRVTVGRRREVPRRA